MKTAVVLFNLGGPDNQEAVQPFLYNLFNDSAIIRLPQPLRHLLAKLISKRRAPLAKKIYDYLGGGSPILPLTQLQANALQDSLGDNYRVFVCMRYWHPMTRNVVADVKVYGPDRIILLPLYPQFSTTTTASSFRAWDLEADRAGLRVNTRKICCYPRAEQFIDAHVLKIRNVYDEAMKYGIPRILFSAHGLPEKIAKAGDPYQWQVEQTVASIIAAFGEYPDFSICYQSRVGPLKWIGPSTEEEIIRAANDNVPIVVVPVAFVSEHSETLVELDIEYKKLAAEYGQENYFRVPALGVEPNYIKALTVLCQTARPGICSQEGKRICQQSATACPMSI